MTKVTMTIIKTNEPIKRINENEVKKKEVNLISSIASTGVYNGLTTVRHT